MKATAMGVSRHLSFAGIGLEFCFIGAMRRSCQWHYAAADAGSPEDQFFLLITVCFDSLQDLYLGDTV
ncbi:MAG: hypothetical protein ABR568_07925 [Pyrinomonadaceae bacterium]